jgi:RNA polymerase sigma factor (sigma-70 family)
MSQSAVIQGWIDRLRAGDAAARRELLNCACARLTRLTRKMLRAYPRVRRWEQTDDVFQNAVMRLYHALAEVRPATVAEFFRLAALNVRRELLDLAKHYYGPRGLGARHASVGDQPDAGSGEQAPSPPADSAADPTRLALWTEFHSQIDKLPEEELAVFDLLWYQGLSQAEAAAVLNISERTLKRRWRSARLKIHAALGGELPR